MNSAVLSLGGLTMVVASSFAMLQENSLISGPLLAGGTVLIVMGLAVVLKDKK